MKLSKFNVTGTWCEVYASLDVVALDESSAINEFKQHFGEKANGLDIEVYNYDERPALLKYWRGHRVSSYTGMYNYADD